MHLIRRGSAGPEVQDVQRRLAELGHVIADPPGRFDASTEDAVRALQQKRGLVADGIIGPDTWRALVEAGYTLGDRNLYTRHPMLRGDDVRDVQDRLNRLGFDAGVIDGLYGPDTEHALREFQLNVGLPEDGIAGPATIAALRRLHRTHQSAAASSVREREGMRTARRDSIAGVRILLDPAHGPDDAGFSAPDGHLEHELTWQLTNRIAGRLIALGAAALLSRGPTTTPSASRRARFANDEDVDLVLSIHLNGLGSRAASGVAGYYFGTEAAISEAGRVLAGRLVDAVVAATAAPHCRTHPSTMAILRETRATAVVLEPGFVTHPEEGRRLADPAYQGVIAQAVTHTVDGYLRGA